MKQIAMEAVLAGMDVKTTISILTGSIVASTGLGTIASKSTTLVRTGEMGVATHGNRVIFDKVRDCEEGYKMTPRIKGPGLKWHKPWNPIHTISTKDRSNDLEPFHVERDKQWLIKSSITWRVSDEGDAPFRALYKVDNGDLVGNITNLCTAGIRTALMDGRIQEAQFKTPALLGSMVLGPVQEICRGPLIDYGLEVRRIDIKDCARSIGQMLGRGQIESGPNGDMGGEVIIPINEQGEIFPGAREFTLLQGDFDQS